MKDYIVLRVVVKFTLPFIILFGLYVQMHGEITPGGGFQSGVVIACAFILYGLIYGLHASQRVFPRWLCLRLSALGLLLYASVGVATLLKGGELLNYSVLSDSPTGGQHLGIWLIELGVCLTVANVMVLIYYGFASHKMRIR